MPIPVNLVVSKDGKTVSNQQYIVGSEKEKKLKLTPEEKSFSLQKLFRLGLFKKKNNLGKDINTVNPIRKDTHIDKNNRIQVQYQKEVWSPFIETLYNKWNSNCYVTDEFHKNRISFYQDLDDMFNNSSIMQRALDIYVDECIQADVNMNPIGIEATKKQKNFLEKFHNRIELNKILRQTLVTFGKFGNAGWYLNLNEHGIEQIELISPYDIIDRMEFSPHEVEEKLKKDNDFHDYYLADDRIKLLIDTLITPDDTATYYNTYLFGFQIKNRIVPPWNFIHFRNMTGDKIFDPFGTPPFITALSAYRQYDFTKSLAAVARGAKFPTGIWEIDMPNSVDPIEKMNLVAEFINEWQNIGLFNSRREDPGVGNTLFTVKGTLEYKEVVPNINLNEVEDIKIAKDDLFYATGLPKNYSDVSGDGITPSGKALMQESKVVARKVFGWQNCLLEGITTADKIEMLLSGDYSIEDINFLLTMPYPDSQISDEIINSQNSLLNLANTALDTLANLMGYENKNLLPIDIIEMIYKQYLPYDDIKINQWINFIRNEREKLKTQGGQENTEIKELPKSNIEKDMGAAPGTLASKVGLESEEEGESSEELKASLLNSINNKEKLKESVHEIYLNKLHESLRNGKLGQKHYYSSRNTTKDFNEKLFTSIDAKVRLEE